MERKEPPYYLAREHSRFLLAPQRRGARRNGCIRRLHIITLEYTKHCAPLKKGNSTELHFQSREGSVCRNFCHFVEDSKLRVSVNNFFVRKKIFEKRLWDLIRSMTALAVFAFLNIDLSSKF